MVIAKQSRIRDKIRQKILEWTMPTLEHNAKNPKTDIDVIRFSGSERKQKRKNRKPISWYHRAFFVKCEYKELDREWISTQLVAIIWIKIGNKCVILEWESAEKSKRIGREKSSWLII